MLKAIVDLKQILANINQIKEQSHKDIIVVAKSDSYNHGAIAVTQYLWENGIKYFAVVETKEAKELINASFLGNILIINSVYEKELGFINDNENIIVTINSIDDAMMLVKHQFKRIVKVHFQIETGMNRIGLKTVEDAKKVIEILKENKNIAINGIYTHYTSLNNLQKQEEEFMSFLNLYDFKMIHAAATPTYKQATIGNYVRVGLDCYGDNSYNQSISVYTKIITINHLSKGESVGYDEKWTAFNDCYVAVIDVGYNDGFIRRNSGNTVLIKNKFYKIIGNVCMNHVFVLVDENVKLYDEVYITNKENNAKNLANYLNTISYEIYCLLKIQEREYKK